MHGYSHLLTGAASDLACASCLHIDDIQPRLSVDELIEHARSFFDDIGETPKSVGYQISSESRGGRLSLASFCKRIVGKGHTVGDALTSITITSSGFEDNEISDTWTPRSVFSVALHGKVLEAFLQSPRDFHQEHELLANFPFRLFGNSFAAAYVFPYPWVFSPVAYCSGISYSPNIRHAGRLTDRDAERVMNWANHCYRGFRSSDGYLRDTYPISIIGRVHVDLPINHVNLETWLTGNRRRGNLSEFNDKFIWTIEDEDLLSVQLMLDDARVLLAGFAPGYTSN